MAKILVLYYSMYGHIETMAHAVADGANRVDGVEVVVKRVPETMQAEAFAKAGGKAQNAPVAIKPAVCGRPALCMAKSPAYLAQPVPAAARNKPLPRPGRRWPTTA